MKVYAILYAGRNNVRQNARKKENDQKSNVGRNEE